MRYLIIFIVVLLAGCSKGKEQAAHEGHVEQENKPSVAMSMEEQGHVSGFAPVDIDPRRVQLIGIATAKVGRRNFTRTLRTVGIVAIDETRTAHIHTKFGGWIDELYVDFTGKPLRKGQPLFSVYSPELLTTQKEYILALQDMEKSSEGARRGGELVAAARRRLELWDVPADAIRRLEETRTPSRTLTINSPINGVVMVKNAFSGMTVGPEMELFVISDLSRVWLQADIFEYDLPNVRPGQKAAISLGALPGRRLTGTATFISPTFGETTRTSKVRFEFDNPAESLKPGMYATVEMALDMGKGLALREDAVIDTGERKIVFVAAGEGHFEPREVMVGARVDDYYQVLSGLSEGESVVTGAQFFLDSESRIRAAGGGGMAGMDMGKK